MLVSRDPLAKSQKYLSTFLGTKETRKTMPRNYDTGARLGLCTFSSEDWTIFENVHASSSRDNVKLSGFESSHRVVDDRQLAQSQRRGLELQPLNLRTMVKKKALTLSTHSGALERVARREDIIKKSYFLARKIFYDCRYHTVKGNNLDFAKKIEAISTRRSTSDIALGDSDGMEGQINKKTTKKQIVNARISVIRNSKLDNSALLASSIGIEYLERGNGLMEDKRGMNRRREW
ncbi:hypothetical protein EVAR_31970_1 [Eumeta japonica]|uniref:Uncharacterized protein n=1 Tax=Eumeta variegata TaxID=151549 RepID=A0A4C1VSI3_EUMVA|nr:hypothetical protein EVAR_31970_1 [Eumeta japonica]